MPVAIAAPATQPTAPAIGPPPNEPTIAPPAAQPIVSPDTPPQTKSTSALESSNILFSPYSFVNMAAMANAADFFQQSQLAFQFKRRQQVKHKPCVRDLRTILEIGIRVHFLFVNLRPKPLPKPTIELRRYRHDSLNSFKSLRSTRQPPLRTKCGNGQSLPAQTTLSCPDKSATTIPCFDYKEYNGDNEL